jgi:hypothetical protein
MKRLVLALIAAVCACALLVPVASARPRTTVPVPNGTYGVLTPQNEYIIFKVKDRKVSGINFASQITCQASDAPMSEQRLFSAGPRAPRGQRVPRNGVLKLNWQEDGGGRYGNIHLELKFGVRDVADVSIIVPEAAGSAEFKESCDGGAFLRFRRGFEAPRF